MNHTLSDLVLTYVKQELEKTELNPVILEIDDGSNSYPKVIIHECNNVSHVRDGQGMISFSNVKTEIIIQTNDLDESKEIMDICDEVCNLGLGLKRESYELKNDVEKDYVQVSLIYSAILNDLRNVYY